MVDVDTDGQTPIDYAAGAGNNVALEFLVEGGENLARCELLRAAARTGCRRAVKLLLEKGAARSADALAAAVECEVKMRGAAELRGDTEAR
jgi:ankyrin repeat protein